MNSNRAVRYPCVFLFASLALPWTVVFFSSIFVSGQHQRYTYEYGVGKKKRKNNEKKAPNTRVPQVRFQLTRVRKDVAEYLSPAAISCPYRKERLEVLTTLREFIHFNLETSFAGWMATRGEWTGQSASRGGRSSGHETLIWSSTRRTFSSASLPKGGDL